MARLTAQIVGGGIGGLSAAIALSRKGMHVSVFEQALAFREVGAGLQLGPNAMAVLADLGIEDAVRAAAKFPDRLVIHDGVSGSVLAHYPLGSDMMRRFGHGYANIHRADLIAILAQAAVDAGVTMRLTSRVDGVNAVTGEMVLATGDVASGDFIIGADGTRSGLRRDLLGGSEPRFTGHVAWRALIPRPPGWPPEVKVWLAPGCHIVAYALREDLLNIVAVESGPTVVEEGWGVPGDPAELRARFSRFVPPVAEILDSVTTVFRWGLFAHRALPHWSTGRVALLGDAAHPMFPYMAQGAGTALEDAWVLADEMAAATDVTTGLAAYGIRRSARVSKIVRTAARNGRLYHMGGVSRHLRNAGFAVLRTVAPGFVEHRFDWLYGHKL